MKKSKVLAAVALAAVVSAVSPMAAMADDMTVSENVSENNPTAKPQQKVTLEKTEAVVPTFTVEIPASVQIGKDAQDLKFSLNLENHEEFIPDDMKISVKIASAGYFSTLNKFAVWDKKNLEEASYEIYYSDRMAGGRYQIGDEIVSWEGSNWGTQTRRIKALNYESIKPGTYEGVINYNISLEAK